MDTYVYFMPGATTLGDILEKEGYHNFYMLGSPAVFGGREEYFTQHGNYEIYDYNTAIEKGKISSDYRISWGYEDYKLYTYAREELLNLASQDEPFNFMMLTVDTHADSTFSCEVCPDIYDNQYYNIWACASKQVYDFVEWIKQQDFYENTTICITGDHCSMQTDFLGDYDENAGSTDRKVYNVFINSPIEPVQMKNRKFTTMDFFPTVLASIGAEIDGDRLGLGTNLFSDVPTLAEEYGYEEMFDELEKKSFFYEMNILYNK
jgi:phosphoglycerol transferase